MLKPNLDYDYNLESAVLGICIAEPDAFGCHFHLLSDECFYKQDHQEIFKALTSLFKEGYPIDQFSVCRFFYGKNILSFKQSGEVAAFVMELMHGVFSSAHMEYWCCMLRELAMKRLMLIITHGGYKEGDVFDSAKDIEDKLKKVMEIRTTDDWLHISQVGIKQVKQMESRDGNTLPGITTSINVLDRLNGGLRAGNLIVIGARPSVGKSAFMGRIAVHAAFKGCKVGIISLEMEDTAIFTRMASADSEVPFYKIDRNDLREEQQRNKVYNTISSLSTLPIYFSDTAQVNSWDIRAKAEKLKRKHGLDILIVDYLQLIEADEKKGQNREQEVAKISRGMKLLAKSLNIPVVLLAQLNRQVNEKGDNKPQLHHLRESGSIEQDADVVMFLHRECLLGNVSDKDGASTEFQADLLVRKWRNGAPVEIKIGFEPEQMRFYDLEAENMKQTKEYFDKPSAGITRSYPISSQDGKDNDVPF